MKALRQLYDFLGASVPVRHNTALPAGAGDGAERRGIAARIEAAIAGDLQLGGCPIWVEVLDGVVVLSGYASSKREVDRAVEIVSGTPGVGTVHNRIALAWW